MSFLPVWRDEWFAGPTPESILAAQHATYMERREVRRVTGIEITADGRILLPSRADRDEVRRQPTGIGHGVLNGGDAAGLALGRAMASVVGSGRLHGRE